jgi:hypothetical protein
MSNNVQSHEQLAEQAAAAERRGRVRHAARVLGAVNARIIGGSQVDLVNVSSRGVLFECDSRLLIGARASVRITTTDANLVVTGRVVRSRVKGLVNGALRYDAALVLDHEFALPPVILAESPAPADEELVAFESDLEPSVDPSPVEAYVAESEASLLEVAHDDLPLTLAAVVEPTSLGAEPMPSEPVALDAEAAALDAEPVAFEAEPIAFEAEPIAFEAEPIAFEAEGEIAFEPAVEFAFADAGEAPFEFEEAALEAGAPAVPADHEAGDPGEAAVLIVEPIAAEEPGGTSMFDATYIAPVYEIEATASQFDVTPPTPVRAAETSSFFDAQPSESYGETPVDTLEAASDPAIEPPAAAPDPEDRVLLQFAATVPHDLAELRRIAADNQW